MINNKNFVKSLIKNKIDFFTGVPDSLFKSLCWHLEKKYKKNNFITANEGSSIGIGIGYNLATKKIPLVYLQNSGLGNTVNPILSMADKKIYGIPLFLLIGWRGEILKKKQIKDEPQHTKQGEITESLLKVLGIKYKILNINSNYKKDIKELSNYSIKNSKPVALLVRKNVFTSLKINDLKNKNLLTREDALKTTLDSIPSKSIKVSTTGMLSRELNEINTEIKNTKFTFMCIGSMGHAISIASGIAIKRKKKKIYCLDGDGSFLMHLGSSATSAQLNNIVHIVFNNKSHDSVGGHQTVSPNLRLSNIAKSLGYKNVYTVQSKDNIKKILKKYIKKNQSLFLEIICKKGNRSNLSRPKSKPAEFKKNFMDII
jgi:phosphonopyruvate decarboxylase